MAQTLRGVALAVALAICMTLVAYVGQPMTIALMFPGFWLAARIHVPDVLGIRAMVVASVLVYSILIWLTVQFVHILVAVSRRLALAWMRSRL